MMNNAGRIFLALGIDAITKILQVFLIVLVVGAAGFFVYIKFFKRRGKKGDGTTDDNMIKPGSRILDTSEFIPVEKISNGIMKLEGEDRYIASINCKGFDFFIASENEIKQTQMDYFGFINTIQSPITLRIDSSAVDLTRQIERYKAIKRKKMEERDLKYNQFLEFRDRLKNIPEGPEKANFEMALYNLSRQIDVLSKSVAHIESLIKYETMLSGRNANPVQEERYIFDWEFNPNDYPENITEKEILEKAEKTLANIAKQMSDSLKASNVRSTRDNDKDLFQLNYRHYHPFAGDLYKDFSGTTAEGGIVSGYRDFEEARKKYEKAIASEEWKATEERLKAQREATLSEDASTANTYSDVLDEDDEDDVVLGSGMREEAVTDDEGGVSF